MPKKINKIFIILLTIFPLFVISIRGWSSAVLLITFIVSLFYLYYRKHPLAPALAMSQNFKDNIKKIVFIFIMPTLAVGISQLFQNEIHLAHFDSPLRLIIAIPILWIISNESLYFQKIKFEDLFLYALPLTVFIIFILTYFDRSVHYDATRLTNSIVDPLSYGGTSLLLGLLCLASIDINSQFGKRFSIIQILGFILGFYLSVRSGSRTGWLALPFVLPICILGIFPNSFLKKITALKVFLIIILFLTAIAIAFFGSSTIYSRWLEAYDEIIRYRNSIINNQLAPDASVAYRITFARIASDIFIHNIWSGIADHQLQNWLAIDRIKIFASQAAIQELLSVGFHNQIINSMVRFGIWGLISMLVLLCYPIAFFALNLINKNGDASKVKLIYSRLGFCYSVFILVNTFTFHMLDYKYMMSFHAMMLAVLFGTVLRNSRLIQS
jgi:O-antigen ligase